MRLAAALSLVVLAACTAESPTAPAQPPAPSPAATTAAASSVEPPTPAPAATAGPSFTAEFLPRGVVDVTNHTDCEVQLRVEWAHSDGQGHWLPWESKTLAIRSGGTTRYAPNCWYRGLNQVGAPGHGLWNHELQTGSSTCGDPGVTTN